MTLYTFQEVTRYVAKSGKCAICGKPCKLREKLYQTLNPFNCNPRGVPKSRDEIRAELEVKAAEWRATPIKHRKCAWAELMERSRQEREARAITKATT